MGRKALPEIVCLVDSREKEPWHFSVEEKKPGEIPIIGSEVVKLDQGDYTVKGLENFLSIERKNGWAELFGNYTPSSNKERFEREMERMSVIPHKYIIVESLINSDIMRLSVPQFVKSPPIKRILDWLVNINVTYGVQFIFAGDYGKQVAKNIMKSVARKYLYE